MSWAVPLIMKASKICIPARSKGPRTPFVDHRHSRRNLPFSSLVSYSFLLPIHLPHDGVTGERISRQERVC